MAAPSFIDASTGATDAGGAWAFTCQASAAAGNLFIVNILIDGATAVVNITGATNIENLAGTDNAWTQIATVVAGAASEAQHWILCGRALSTSAPTISGTNSTSEDLYFQSYQFQDVATGTTLATVIENGTAGTAVNGTGTGTTITDTAVTTLGVDRLALQVFGGNDDTIWSGGLEGGSGGEYFTETVNYAEASGTDGTVTLWTCAKPTAATIDGNSVTAITSLAWSNVGFALIGTTVAGDTSIPVDIITERRTPRRRMLQRI